MIFRKIHLRSHRNDWVERMSWVQSFCGVLLTGMGSEKNTRGLPVPISISRASKAHESNLILDIPLQPTAEFDYNH